MHSRQRLHGYGSALAALAAACLATGCSLAPAYLRPDAPVPEQWSDGAIEREDGAARTSSADALMWRAFVVDETLRDLIDTALANSRSLRQTLLNVEAARAQYRIQDADRRPGLRVDAGTTRQRTPDVSGVQSNHQVGLGLAAFELDLSGRVRNLSEAALQDYLATEEAAHGAQVSLVGEVIRAYLIRDSAQQRYLLGTRMLEARETSLGLLARLRARGFASELDHQEAVGLVQQVTADLERIDREFRQASNALSLLIGVSDTGELPTYLNPGTSLVQRIAPGTPSDLLMRRPDIRAAERRLKARNADIGAARAAFFPRISLTGSFGQSSSELSGLFDRRQRAWSFSPQITLPIFDGGANRANLDLAHMRKHIAVAAYEQSIQTAFREVSDALAAADTLRREEDALRALARASEEARRLSELRYRSGIDDHLRFLDAQRSELAGRMAVIEVQTQRQIALATLFRALGGGWQEEAFAHDDVPTP